jgi:hypothetical protein
VASSTASIFASVATWAQSRGELGEDGLNRWAPSVSDGDTITGGRPGSFVKMGRGTAEAGRRRGKRPVKPFPKWNSFSI